MEPDETPTQSGIEPTGQQCIAAIFAAYDHARRIGEAAANGAPTWELVRKLAMMVDEMDRTLEWRVLGVSTELWSTSDALRSESREPTVSRPHDMEDE